MDPYEILKISPSAPKAVIDAAYRALAKQYHPDANQGSGNTSWYEEKMKQLNWAYSILSDDEKRNAYDESLRSKQNFTYSSPDRTNSTSSYEFRGAKEAATKYTEAQNVAKNASIFSKIPSSIYIFGALIIIILVMHFIDDTPTTSSSSTTPPPTTFNQPAEIPPETGTLAIFSNEAPTSPFGIEIPANGHDLHITPQLGRSCGGG